MAKQRVQAAFLAMFLIPAAAQAGDWPQFRGSSGAGLADEAKVPTEWGPDTNVRWKVKLPGVAWSQPVTWGDKIFVTTAVTDNQPRPRRENGGPGWGGEPPNVTYRWLVLCLDGATGKVVWERVAHEGRPTIHIHPNNTYATETPVTDGERLIAYFGMTGIYCYDLSGKLLWKKDLGTFPTQFGWGTASSPVLLGDRVYVQCDNDKVSFLVALDKKTGEEAWRVARDEWSNWATPYVWKNKQRTELVAAGGKKMRSYDPATGKLLWEMAGSGRTATTPVGDEQMLYVDSYDRLMGRDGILAAIRAGASGDISLKKGQTDNASVAWSAKLNYYRMASPLLYAGCLYSLVQHSGMVRCYDAKTGQEHYHQRLPKSVGCVASPWASDGKVYFLDQTGVTVVLQAGPEFKVVATNSLDEMCWASPAVAGEKLLLRGVENLYCIEKQAGQR